MNSFFDELFSVIPFWLFIVLVLSAIVLGRGIRWWLDRREVAKEVEKKERQKAEKVQRKRNQKRLKAAKNRKG